MRALFNQITSLSLRFRWITIILTVAIIVGGILAFTQLNQELLPNIEFPQTFIVNQNGGASSDQILAMYSLPIERSAQEVSGVVNVETISNDGFGFVIVRNEFGLDQEQLVQDLRDKLNDLPLPVRHVQPPEGKTASDLVGELSPEAVLWLYQWGQQENSGFIPQLTREALAAFSPEALDALPEEAFSDLATDLRTEILDGRNGNGTPSAFDPAAPPALPESWQGDARFKTVEDIIELTTTRNLAGIFNDFIENSEIIGPLGTTEDLTVTDIQLLLDIENACRALDRPEEITLENDPCSFIAELDAATVLALPDDIIAALPADYLDRMSPIERNEIAEVRAAEALSGQTRERQNVLLPDTWRVEAPQIITFSFSDIPLGAISVNSDTLSAAELSAFVENELVPRLRDVDLVANIGTDGGEIIPIPIQNTARSEVGLPLLEDTQSGEPAQAETTTSVSEIPEGPALPPIWNALAGIIGADEFDTADDIMKVIGSDIQGVPINSAADFINALAEQPTAKPLLDTLNQDILDYLAQQEADFYDNLSPDILKQVSGEGEPAESAVQQDYPEGPALPPIWNALAGIIGADEFDTADDIMKVIGSDIQGVPINSAADFINALAEQPTAKPLLDTLNQDILDYLAQQEADFYDNLSPDILSPALGDPWRELSAQPMMASMPLNTVSDLNAAGAAETINKIIDATSGVTAYTVRLIDSLSPEAITALVEENPNFLSDISPEALRYFSREALQTDAVSDFLSQTSDTALVEDVQAIIDGEPTAAETILASEESDNAFVDPNAPALPASWTPVAQFVGATELDSADDIFNVPGYAGAADLINQFATGGNGQGLVRDLIQENWLYLAEQEEGFWDNLNGSALRLINQETVDITALPEDVQNRIAAGGEAYEPEETVTRTDFNPSFVVTIFKEDTANTVVGWENVKTVLDDFNEREDITVDEIFEQASFITDSLDGVVREGTLGAIMAIIMILIFMNVSFRSTAVVAVSIPGSVFFAFVLIHILPGNMYSILAPIVDDVGRDTTLGGILTVILRLFPEKFTLNIMTLSGMTVAIGRVVDDSIVVLENIYRNIGMLKPGEDSRENKYAAILNGTREVSVAIFAATLTTMVVFLPLGLFGGVVGAFFLPFGLAVTYALIGSYIVSITIVPVLASFFITRESMPEEGTIAIRDSMTGLQKIWVRISNIFIGSVEWMGEIYGVLIQFALKNIGTRLLVIALAVISLFAGLFLMGLRPVQFLPSLGEPTISVTVDLPAEFEGKPITIAQTNARVTLLENWLMEQKSSNPDIKTIQVTVGSAGGFDFTPTANINETAASITAVMASQAALDSFVPRIREQAELIFNDLNNNQIPDYEENGDSAVVAASNVTVSGAASDGGFGGFSLVLKGADDAAEQPTLSELAAYNETILTTLNEIDGLVNVELESDFGTGSTTYIRIDGVPALRYVGELETDDTLGTTQEALTKTQDAIDVLYEANDGLTVPVEISQGFESEQQAEGIAEIFISMGIATLIAYALLVITFIGFGSVLDILTGFILPIEILVSLPLSIVGAAIALTVTNRVLGLPAMVGLLMLIGIVVTNAIVLLDRVQQNKREKGMNTHDALVEAGRTRLRPILMTAATTTVAQIPLAASTESGAIIAAELGTVVIGGLVSSTMLTLIVLPVIYSLIDSGLGGLMRLFGLSSGSPSEPAKSPVGD